MSDVKIPTCCDECEHERCLFDEFCSNFIETALWKVERELIESRVEAGNLRQRALRKKLFMCFARFNGVVGNREEHPPCVVTGIRKLIPSPFFMGYKRTRDDTDNRAVDVNGNKVDGMKWVKTATGKYELKIEEIYVVADKGWQKRSKGKVEE